MNHDTTQPIGPGQPGFDPSRIEAIPEAAASTLMLVGLLTALGMMSLNRSVSRKFKRGTLTPMPTCLKYGGGK